MMTAAIASLFVREDEAPDAQLDGEHQEEMRHELARLRREVGGLRRQLRP
ncbi:MAG TPA: hypothetical protein VM285_02560 [Polyangia bacterium]|jgi:hypothetical protein|nr:hypothetical protein [Polyangia bacterium]